MTFSRVQTTILSHTIPVLYTVSGKKVPLYFLP